MQIEPELFDDVASKVKASYQEWSDAAWEHGHDDPRVVRLWDIYTSWQTKHEKGIVYEPRF